MEASIAVNKLKLLTMDSFSVTDTYRNILETALKSLRKGTVNSHAHHTEKERLNIKRKRREGHRRREQPALDATRGLLSPNDCKRRESAKEQTQTKRQRILQRVVSKAPSCPRDAGAQPAPGPRGQSRGCLQSHSLRVADLFNTRVLPLRQAPATRSCTQGPPPTPP